MLLAAIITLADGVSPLHTNTHAEVVR
jgi:hypothetical protein